MKYRYFLYAIAAAGIVFFIAVAGSGCAQIGSPTGGPRDTIPPVLVSAYPKIMATNFKGNKITLQFNEYIDVQDVQTNVLVSPFPKTNPMVDFKLKTVTVKLKDTLLPNTTYAINFGNAIRDNNEGNPFKNFTYVFSTGNTIDSLQLKGKVIIAETGKKDSTIIAMLYRNVDDSAVQKRKPDYIAKLDSSGHYTFSNLAAGRYKLYALKDGDGGKTYNSKTELFAFSDADVAISDSTPPVTLYAYAEEKDTRKTPSPSLVKPTAADKRLRYTTTLSNSEQDLLTDLSLTVNKPLKTFEPQN
ncbi:MAG: Ig-like domain-containing protein, partial [Aquabacterium sp.]|nr:Ig-like domain-containing protein [Ferruginibacter sp.]